MLSVMAGSRQPMYSPLLKVMCFFCIIRHQNVYRCFPFDAVNTINDVYVCGILSDDLTVPIVAFCSLFHIYVKNFPSLCMQQFFSLSHMYEMENFF